MPNDPKKSEPQSALPADRLPESRPANTALESWLVAPELPVADGLPPWLSTADLPEELPSPPRPATLERPAAPVAASPVGVTRPNATAALAPAQPAPPVGPSVVAATGRASPRLEVKAPPLERIVPAPRKGEPISYGIVTRNPSAKAVASYCMVHTLPAGVRFVKAEPPAEVRDNQLIWNLTDIASGALQRLTVWVEPVSASETWTQEPAVFQTVLSHQTRIVKPRLAVVVSGPEQVVLGGAAVFQMTVANHGSGAASAVVLRQQLATGLHHPQSDRIEVALGSLAPGEVVKLSLPTLAMRAGNQVLDLTVAAKDGFMATAQATVLVTRAALSVNMAAAAQCLLHQTLDCRIDVANTGTASATGVRLAYTVPAGLAFLSADHGGSYDAETRSVRWDVGTLVAAQVLSRAVQVRGDVPGDYTHRLAAGAGQGLEAHRLIPVGIELETPKGGGILRKLLAEIDAEAAPRPEVQAQSNGSAVARRAGRLAEQYIIFGLAGTDYAVPVTNVLETGRALSITPVPNLPDWVLGVANFRGDIVSMVDLRTFLGIERQASAEASSLLVVRAREEDLATALLVDRIKGIRALPEDRITDTVAGVSDRVVAYLRGVTDLDGRLLVLLDLDRLLLSTEMRQFEFA